MRPLNPRQETETEIYFAEFLISLFLVEQWKWPQFLFALLSDQ